MAILNKNIITTILSILAIVNLLTSCDSGDIYPRETKYEEIIVNVDAALIFTNTDAFPANYNVMLGAFIGTSPFPLAYKLVEKPQTADTVVITISSLPKGTTHLALALAEKVGNKKIYSFYQHPVSGESEDIVINETVNMATFGRLQSQIFTAQCLQCHGGGGMAAGLDLSETNAYTNLVNMASKADNSPKNRVTPHNLHNSFLLDVLEENVPAVSTNHTTLSTLDAIDDINLIKTWIEDGAKNN